MENKKLIQEDLNRFNSIVNYGKLNEDVTDGNAPRKRRTEPTGGEEFYQTRTGLSPERETEIDFEFEDLKEELTVIGDKLIMIYTELEENYGEEGVKEFNYFMDNLHDSLNL